MATISDTLRTAARRPRVHDAQIVTKLPKRAKELVNEIARGRGTFEATIVREALAEYLERRGYRM
jgi:hypothetical protein